jgi:glycosyltransferase involved in cell wall biosynthesis
MPDTDIHISVCICTYKRKEQLAYLLRMLDGQETRGLFSYSIVVADNDAEKSAEEVVHVLSRQLTVPICYCVQPCQNIALVRNTALGKATGDYVAFIDDDEFPESRWLVELYQTCMTYRVDGVLGPVVPHFESPPPRWIIKGGFCNRPRHQTGFQIDCGEGRTGNLLFRREIIEGMAPVFRPEFGGGGEDRDFFRRIIGQGREFVWCDQAVAYEWVPPVRMKRRFMLRRALLRGKMSLGRSRNALEVGKSLCALAAYSLVLPLFLVTRHHLFMKYLIKSCDHAGKLLALAGINPVRENYIIE